MLCVTHSDNMLITSRAAVHKKIVSRGVRWLFLNKKTGARDQHVQLHSVALPSWPKGGTTDVTHKSAQH